MSLAQHRTPPAPYLRQGFEEHIYFTNEVTDSAQDNSNIIYQYFNYSIVQLSFFSGHCDILSYSIKFLYLIIY